VLNRNLGHTDCLSNVWVVRRDEMGEIVENHVFSILDILHSNGPGGQWHIFQINKIVMNVILEQWTGKEEGGGAGGGM